ncbi:MAG: hypothetical protein DWQ04_31965 [Chloroflexi bacterium]|nr:MAG: hypothetical protein DWQ04_31965 [Chloroflexota bacterium]
MPQSFECPNCHAPLDFDAKRPSATVRCDYCGSTVIVPDSLRGVHQQSEVGMDQAYVLAEAAQLVQGGRKIEAVKQVREAFGMSLKDAKDVVDAIERHETVHLGELSMGAVQFEVSSSEERPFPQTQARGSSCLRTIFVFLALILVGIGALFAFVMISGPDVFLTESQEESIRQQVEEALEGTPVSIEIPDIEIQPISTVSIEIVVPTFEALTVTTSDYAEELLQFGGEEGVGPGFFNDTRRLAVDAEGNIYAGDYNGGRIQVFDVDGNFLSQINVGQELYMTAMTVDRNGVVYIGDAFDILRFDSESGAGLDPLPYEMLVRTMATAPDGSVIIKGRERLLRLDAQGEVTLDLVDAFAEIPDFKTTQEDVAVDGLGNIYVLGSETIYKLDANGRFITRIGSKGDGVDQFMTSPTAIAVDGRGRVYANDFNGILVFDENGRYLDTIPFSGVAFDMLVTTQNQLLVMDRNGNRVVTFRLK